METAAAPSAAPAAAPSSSAPAPSSTPSAAPATSPAPSGAPASAPAPGTAAPSAAPEPKLYRVKVYGEEREIPAEHVDILAERLGVDPQEILKGGGLLSAGHKRLQEAAKLRKEWEEQEKARKARYEDPRVTQIKQQNPGMDDEDAYALARVLALKEREEMSPELRALADEKAKREALEKQLREREETGKKAEVEAQTKAEAAKIERGLIEAVTKHGLGKSTATARAVLQHMETMARAGEVVDVEAAALFVKRRLQADDVERLGAMSDEQIETWLGKPLIDRILKRSVDKLRQPGAVVPPPPPTPKPPAEEGRKYVTEAEWRERHGIG